MEQSLSGTIEKGVHTLPVRMYYSDTDAGQVVYHSRYLDMAEHGRSEMFRLVGGNQFEMIQKEGLVFVVRQLSVDYNSPGFLDDLLRVETRITRCEAFTVHFSQRILRDELCLAELKVKAGSISLKTGRPTPMPREWKEAVSQVLSPLPAGK